MCHRCTLCSIASGRGMPKKEGQEGSGVFVPSPAANAVLTALFGAEVVGALYALSAGARAPALLRLATPCARHREPTGARPRCAGAVPPFSPLEPKMCAAALVAACLLIFPLINLVKMTSARFGRAFSRTALARVGDPLSKRRTMHKFQDQMWQLFIHGSMTAFELYILFVEDHGAWTKEERAGVLNNEFASLWTPHPYNQPNNTSLHLFYLVQLAIWIDTCFSHRFIEERHKDYVMMYVHHLVTILLVLGSYANNYLRVGTVILFLHDSSDVFLDLLKIFNYLKLEGRRGCFIIEFAFLANLLVWAYTRLYIFPVRIVWTGVWRGSREVVMHQLLSGYTHPDYGPVPEEQLWLKGGGRWGRPSFAVGDGDFPLWDDMWRNPTNPYLNMYWACSISLTVLCIMHVIWCARPARVPPRAPPARPRARRTRAPCHALGARRTAHASHRCPRRERRALGPVQVPDVLADPVPHVLRDGLGRHGAARGGCGRLRGRVRQ